MRAPITLIEPLSDLSVAQLADWITGLAYDRPARPDFPYPREYRAAADFLIAVLYQINDESVSLRFGNAAGMAFQRFLASGGYVPNDVKKDNAEVASNFLFLVEALPCDRGTATELVATLISMLCSSALRAFPNQEIDLHRRVLLALPGKLDAAPYYESEAPKCLCDDLKNRDYAADAFAVLVRLTPGSAGDYLRTVIATLQGSRRPTAQLLAGLVLAMARHPISPRTIFLALAEVATDRTRREFGEELAALSPEGLLPLWNKVFPQNEPALSGLDPMVLQIAREVEEFLARELETPMFSTVDEVAWRAVERDYGDELADREIKRWKKSGNPQTEVLDCDRLAAVVKAFDNGVWQRRLALSNLSDMPAPMRNERDRRMFAARSIRECVRRVASTAWWEVDRSEFRDLVSDLNLDHYLTEVAALLPDQPSKGKRLKVAVSPFPEDQLFFSILETAGNLRQRVVFEPLRIPWADHNSLDADCSLMNELAITDAIRSETDHSHAVFQHLGYFVFWNKPTPELMTSEARLRFALNKGFRRYNNGEYREMAKRLEQKLNIMEQRQPAARSWSEDFESFIGGTGDSNLYIGGSINSRLLLRLWGTTGRIHAVCTPADFMATLGSMPWNRLVLGSDIRERINDHKRSQLLLARLVRLYREVGKFIHKSAGRAMDSDPIGRKLVRHFMHILAKGIDQQDDGIWNFVVSEEDMRALILEDNRFVFDETDVRVRTPVAVTL